SIGDAMTIDPDNPQVVGTFVTEQDAALAVGRLESVGIQAHIWGADSSSAWGETHANVQVVVRQADVDRARQALLRRALCVARCTNCTAAITQGRIAMHATVLGRLLAGLFGLECRFQAEGDEAEEAIIPRGGSRVGYRCRNCGFVAIEPAD